jgi:hypothetical protein
MLSLLPKAAEACPQTWAECRVMIKMSAVGNYIKESFPAVYYIREYSPKYSSGKEDYQRFLSLKKRAGHFLEGKIAIALLSVSFVLGYPIERMNKFFNYLSELKSEKNR